MNGQDHVTSTQMDIKPDPMQLQQAHDNMMNVMQAQQQLPPGYHFGYGGMSPIMQSPHSSLGSPQASLGSPGAFQF